MQIYGIVYIGVWMFVSVLVFHWDVWHSWAMKSDSDGKADLQGQFCAHIPYTHFHLSPVLQNLLTHTKYYSHTHTYICVYVYAIICQIGID